MALDSVPIPKDFSPISPNILEIREIRLFSESLTLRSHTTDRRTNKQSHLENTNWPDLTVT